MNSNRLKQIDFVPSYENGSWVVREETFRLVDGEPVDIEPSNIWHFKTDREADNFIDRWIACKGHL
jgi:hypothetical protein